MAAERYTPRWWLAQVKKAKRRAKYYPGSADQAFEWAVACGRAGMAGSDTPSLPPIAKVGQAAGPFAEMLVELRKRVPGACWFDQAWPERGEDFARAVFEMRLGAMAFFAVADESLLRNNGPGRHGRQLAKSL